MTRRTLPRSASRRGRSLLTLDEWGITYSELELVVALLAAENVGLNGVTVDALADIGACSPGGVRMHLLERKRLAVCLGYTGPRRREKLWGAHPRARGLLGFERLREVG